MKISTKKIAYLSFLTALTIILTRILSIRIPIAGVEGVRIGFGSLPIIFAGIAFGPIAGGIVGALGDLLGYFINTLFGVPFAVLMPPRLISQLINIPIYAYFIKTLLSHNTVKIRKIQAGNSC